MLKPETDDMNNIVQEGVRTLILTWRLNAKTNENIHQHHCKGKKKKKQRP